jgi:hypothetical protein
VPTNDREEKTFGVDCEFSPQSRVGFFTSRLGEVGLDEGVMEMHRRSTGIKAERSE